MTIKASLTQHIGIPFIVLISLMIILAPIETIINTFELRPSYSLKQLSVEMWRLLSGHFVHASWPHLFVNLLNLLLLRFVFREWVCTKTLILLLVFNALFISVGLWLSTQLTSYVGFSGIFHGLLLYLLLRYWKTARIIFSVAIICVVSKVIYEQLYGASHMLAELIGIAIAINAHALGTAAGIIFYLAQAALYTTQISTNDSK